jgi:hypothetical protein
MSYNSWDDKKPKRGKFELENGKLTIKSDLRWKHLVYRWDVPEAVLADQFDHLDEDEATDGFFQYNGHWYHTSDFMLPGDVFSKLGWDGYSSDSYFSGVVIALTNDGEEYIVGTYFS